eukprot:9523865-Alexandrium_andersonii.AAC.1
MPRSTASWPSICSPELLRWAARPPCGACGRAPLEPSLEPCACLFKQSCAMQSVGVQRASGVWVWVASV